MAENIKDIPNSIEAEYAVLGSILKRSESFNDIADYFTKEDYFYQPKNKIIFHSIYELFTRNEPLDLTTVANELDKNSQLEKIGGRLYLIDLIDGVPSTLNIKAYADIVIEKAKLRTIINIADDAIRECYGGQKSTMEILDQIDSAIISSNGERGGNIIHAGIKASDIVYEIQTRDEAKLKSRYIETRIAGLNDCINGIFKADLTVVGAPPSQGKTSFALDVALYSKRRTLYIGLDETARAAAMRLLTSLTGITNTQMNNYKFKFNEEELKKLGEASAEISQSSIYLCEQTALTAYQIRALARQHQKQYGLDLLIVDYIQQIADNFKAETRNLEVTRQIRVLKEIAKELDIAVLAVSQINREFNQLPFKPKHKMYGFPKLSHLRDSGTIEQEANVVLFVWNLAQAARDRGVLQDDSLWTDEQLMSIRSGAEPSFICVAKNKVGPKAMIPCLWRGDQMRFFSETKLEEKTLDKDIEMF